MAVDVVPPTGTGNKVISFYQSVIAEMKRVTWPEWGEVRRATIAIIIFVLVLGLFIWLLDVTLQGLLVRLIPSLFAGGR